jgi:inhibitor of KinA sporulation pathway (predicted exonuclease)
MKGSVLVIDLEMTCNDDDSIPPEAMEVIEIGAVVATTSGEVIAQFHSFVKPNINPVLTNFCKQLTGIEQREVDYAPSLSTAMYALVKFVQLQEPLLYWGSWGKSDEKQIVLECLRHSIENPLCSLRHINLKGNFAKVRKIRQVGMTKALELAGLKKDGKGHRALDDAVNVAKLVPFCVIY